MSQASQPQREAGRRVGWMLVFGLVMASAPASADPITWTFTDAFINHQESIQGDFVYDVDTNTVSDFDITVSAGFFIGTAFSYNPGDAFVFEAASSPSTGTSISFYQNGAANPAPPLAADFILQTFTELTDAGGVISLDGTITAEYLNDFPQQSDIHGSGTLVGVGTTPEPSSFGIAGLGFGLLAITRRLRRPAA